MTAQVVLVDSNVILDLLTEDEKWFAWSARALERCADRQLLAINPIIYAEISIGFTRIEELDLALPESMFARLPLPWEAAFLAGKCFQRYRKKGGTKNAPLPDFYIGAHATTKALPLLTRDASRFRTYFPKLRLISPELH
jgi:predicted nucleic acid-binding protein